MKTCPKCNSHRVGHFRLDSDWAPHAGDWTCGNHDEKWNPHKDAGFTEEDLKSFDSNSRPDIECYVCCACGACFD